MHEATRRLLGVLLRHVDGFIADKRSVVIGATNRCLYLNDYLVFLYALYGCMLYSKKLPKRQKERREKNQGKRDKIYIYLPQHS